MSFTITKSTATPRRARRWLQYVASPIGIALAVGAFLLTSPSQSPQRQAPATSEQPSVTTGSSASVGIRLVYYIVASQSEASELKSQIGSGLFAVENDEGKEILVVDSAEAQTTIFRYLTMFREELSQAGGSVRIVDLRSN